MMFEPTVEVNIILFFVMLNPSFPIHFARYDTDESDEKMPLMDSVTKRNCEEIYKHCFVRVKNIRFFKLAISTMLFRATFTRPDRTVTR